MCNKAKLLNPNSFLLGVPGSGKSFSAKMLIVFLALATGDDILICDPEREYASLIEAMGGEVIRIAAGSKDHINAMDMVDGYGAVSYTHLWMSLVMYRCLMIFQRYSVLCVQER